MSWQSDFITNPSSSNYSKNTPGSVASTSVFISPSGAMQSTNSNFITRYAGSSNSSLNSPSTQSFTFFSPQTALMSSSVPQFTLFQETPSSNSPSSSSTSSSCSTSSSSSSSNQVTIVNNNFQLQTSSSSSKNLIINQVIDLLRRSKIKLVAFDFDCTIVNVHTGGQWIDSAEELAKYVRPCFKELISVLLKSNEFYVCVVTYSPQEELIRDVLRISLKDDINNINDLTKRVIIKGNTREFVEDYGIEACYSNGKEIHLEYCRKLFEQFSKKMNGKSERFTDENVILIDDDVQNIKIAKDNGHLAFQVNSSVQLVDFYNYLVSVV